MNGKAYTVGEVAEMMGLSPQTITRLFENERGVIVLARPERKHTQGYRSIRIPQVVYERVLRNLSVKWPDRPLPVVLVWGEG